MITGVIGHFHSSDDRLGLSGKHRGVIGESQKGAVSTALALTWQPCAWMLCSAVQRVASRSRSCESASENIIRPLCRRTLSPEGSNVRSLLSSTVIRHGRYAASEPFQVLTARALHHRILPRRPSMVSSGPGGLVVGRDVGMRSVAILQPK